MAPKYKDLFDQLMSNSMVKNDCLESTYKTNPLGVPYFTHKGQLLRVSRAAWEYHNGKIPKGLFVCHRCDNPKCFKLDHLFLGTPSENMQDMIRKGRDNIFGNRKYSFEVLRKSEALRREGYSYSQIAKILGINNAAIKSHLFRHKIEKGNPVPRPRKHGLDLIEKIRLLKAKGLSDVDIYKKLKMSESTFYRMRQAMKGLGA